VRSWVLGMCFAALAITGCGHSHDHMVVRTLPTSRSMADRPAQLASALLYNPKPGRYSATDIAARSDWPSTNAFYSPGQVISFRERFIDYQGRGFNDWNHTYRRFDAVRVGTGYR